MTVLIYFFLFDNFTEERRFDEKRSDEAEWNSGKEFSKSAAALNDIFSLLEYSVKIIWYSELYFVVSHQFLFLND